MRPTGVITLFLTFAGAVASAQPTMPTFANLAYGPHPRNRLDLYLPPGPPGAARPLIIWIHGGGWQNGDKGGGASKAQALLQAGFSFASINYRLSSDATWPAQIHDCKAAVRWLRANAATYNLDTTRIGVWGSSAGGHLVAELGTSSDVFSLEGSVGGNLLYPSRVQAVADYFGPANLFTMGGFHENCDSPESKLLGFCVGDMLDNLNNPAWADEVALATSASPTLLVTPTDPPFHIAHGSADGTVPPSQSEDLYDALLAAGVEATLRIVPGAGHGLPVSEDAFVRAFFTEHLIAEWQVGDLTGDGSVDDIDLGLLLAGYGVNAGGDIDRDGDTDDADLGAMLANWSE